MATQILNVTFDGVNAVSRLPGQSPVAWDTGGSRPTIDRYSVYVAMPDDLDATLNFTGSDWRVRTLQVAGDDHVTRLVDLDNGTGREIEYLNLGYDSEVDLTSTKVRYMNGWEGAMHDITLGPQNDWMHWISLGADVNKLDTSVGWIGGIEVYRGRAEITVRGETGNISLTNSDDLLVVNGGHVKSATLRNGDDTAIVRNGGRITSLEDFGGTGDVRVLNDSQLDSFQGGEGDVNIALKGTGRAESIRVYNGDFTFSSENGFVQSIYTSGGSSDVTVGSGGANSIRLFSGTAQTHKITGSADGYIGSIDTTDSGSNVNDDQSATIKLVYFAGTVRTGNGNDKITTGNGQTGYVDLVSTSGGNDTIILGSGGAGAIHASRGNDVIQVRDLFYNAEDQAVVVRGGDGTDQLSFAAFSKGVTFTLAGTGTVQEAAKDSGFFSEFGIENLTGSGKGDKLTGDTGNNVLTGRGGADRMWGGDRNDTLKGDAGSDRLYGQNGKDDLRGGKGKDVLDGGKGNDILRGNQGEDVFVFGKLSGTDTVKDYQDNIDTLRLVGHTGGFADVTISNQSGDKVVVHDNGTIILEGSAGITLTATDFDFV